MTAQIIKDFNSLLEALIQQIEPLTGKSYHFLFTKLIKFNAVLPIKTFNQYALEWKDKIINKDETFFLQKNIIKQAINSNENIIHDIFQLQDVWKKLDKTSKDNLWEIVNALLVLGEQYNNI